MRVDADTDMFNHVSELRSDQIRLAEIHSHHNIGTMIYHVTLWDCIALTKMILHVGRVALLGTDTRNVM